MVPENLLLDYNAQIVYFKSNDIVFYEKQKADFFFQVKKGGVKMFNLNENGKEFVQGMFHAGESFGEPPLFGNFKYPASAVITEKTSLFKLAKSDLMRLLENNFDIHLRVTSTLAKRLSYKAMILKEISVHPPEHRILTLIDFLRKKENSLQAYKVDLTRQQIADLTGLRVETIIRAVKQLETDGEIEIIKRKIVRKKH